MDKVTPSHVEELAGAGDERLRGASLVGTAKENAVLEQNLTPLEAIKAYPMALFWALMVSMCVIMEGYDTILIGNFYAYPAFQKKYGVPVEGHGYQLTAPWQAGLGNAAGVGAFFGALANGYLVDRFGMKKTIVSSLVVLSCFIAMTFEAPNIKVLLAGELLCG
jgi:MFS transporter, SP family, general alpha glucoside:H+ symporter